LPPDKSAPVKIRWRVLRLRMEESCKYIDYAVADSFKWVGLQLGIWKRG
jgi:hypothetical protein